MNHESSIYALKGAADEFDLDPENIELNRLVNQHTTPRARKRCQAEAQASQAALRSRIISVLLWTLLTLCLGICARSGLLTSAQGVWGAFVCAVGALVSFFRLTTKWGEVV